MVIKLNRSILCVNHYCESLPDYNTKVFLSVHKNLVLGIPNHCVMKAVTKTIDICK